MIRLLPCLNLALVWVSGVLIKSRLLIVALRQHLKVVWVSYSHILLAVYMQHYFKMCHYN